MEIILFIAVVILLFWIGNISGRLSKLERQSHSQNQVSVEPLHDMPVPTPVFSETSFPSAATHAPVSAFESRSQEKLLTTEDHKEPQSAYSWLTKFGMLAIAIGIAFFFKLAVDRGWINEWMRVLCGFIVGGLFVFLGELWKEKYQKYSYAMSGGGVLILDFTIYAAFNFYHLLPQPIALALMVLVSALAVWLSIKRKSLTLAILGIVGAYGAPLLLSSGQNQQGMLFGYLLVLSLAIVVVLWRKFWLELVFLGLVASIFDFSVWASNYSTQANTWGSVSFIIASLVLFVLVVAALFRHHATTQTLPGHADKNFSILSVFAGLFYFISIYSLLHKNFHDFLPLLMVLGAVIWWVAYLLVDRLNFKMTNYCLSLVGTVLIILAAYWQFSGRAFDAVLIAIALTSVIIGYVVKRAEFNTWGLLALYYSLIVVSFEPYKATDTQFLLNGKFALMLLESAGLIFAGWLSSKVQVSDGEKNVQTLSEVAAAILLWIAVSFEISHSYKGLGAAQGMSLWWVILPPILAFMAYVGKRKILAAVALGLLVIGAFRVLFLPYDSSNYIFLVNVKFGLMFLQTVAFLAIAALQEQTSPDGKNVSSGDFLKVCASLYLWFAVSWEITQYYRGNGSENARNLVLSLWWMIYAAVLMPLSAIRGFAVLRKVAVVFFGLAIAKVFLYDVGTLDTGYRIVSFIVLGVILLSISFIYQKHKEKITEFLEGQKHNNINGL